MFLDRETYWIDTCQSDSNLLASCGQNKALMIFDKREAKIVKAFEDVHSGQIFQNFFNFILINLKII